MAIDREATLRNAEKFLRVGRLDAAITEYARVVEEQPRDWATANTLGDLYLRAAQAGRAVALYRRIAEDLLAEGFYPKAGAIFKKILKITPDDEGCQLHLAEISVRQGLLADAKAYFQAVASRRRNRGDTAGTDQIEVRLGSIDPADFAARLGAARALERMADLTAAARRYRELYDEFMEQGRENDAAAALQDCIRCDPAAKDPDTLLALAAIEFRADRFDSANSLLSQTLEGGGSRDTVAALAWTLIDTNVRAAMLCVHAAADAAIAAGEFAEAAAVLREFTTRVPGQIDTLLRLVEASVDGGLDGTVYEAQAQLADAYLAAGHPHEARMIAEDLVTRDPSDASHIHRLRRALEALGVADVDAAIAERARAHMPSSDGLLDNLTGDTPSAPASGAILTFEPHEAEASAVDDASVAREPVEAPVTARPEPEGPSPVPEVVEIDLTVLLGELEGQFASPEPPAALRPARDLEDVFAGIRADASRAEDADESGEHMSLARTYIEMGLPGEAVNSLMIAARSPEHRFAAASILAGIYRDQSDLTRAIEWFERAAEAPAPTADQGHTLLYDLGDVLEAIGESARALAVFLELAADAPDFRDVRARVTDLSNAGTEG